MGYVYILLTVIFSAYGQLVLKWRMPRFGAFPAALGDQLHYLVQVLLDGWVLSSFAAAVVASFTWIAALTKFQLSYAYPFMSLAFVLVMLGSWQWLGEPLTLNRVLGLCLILVGLILASK